MVMLISGAVCSQHGVPSQFSVQLLWFSSLGLTYFISSLAQARYPNNYTPSQNLSAGYQGNTEDPQPIVLASTGLRLTIVVGYLE